MKKLHIGFSGGGTKIVGLYGVAEILSKKYRPQVVSGVSAGAVIALLWVTKTLHRISVRELILNLDLDTFFNQKPVTKKGKLSWRAYWNLIRGKDYLGRQDRLVDQMCKVINEKDWHDYLNDKKAPDCWVGMVDIRHGSRVYANLKDYDRKTAFNLVLASSSIPVFIPPVEFQGMLLVDGGNRDHSPSAWILNKYRGQIGANISVYTRPDNYALSRYDRRGLLRALFRTIDIFNVEVSKMDEFMERTIAEDYQIDSRLLFLPSIMKDPYDVDRDRLKALYLHGQSIAKDL